MTINKTIKEALDKCHMTQKELAEKLFVQPQAVSKWVNGECEPSKENMIRLNEILNINLFEQMVERNMETPILSEFDFEEIQNLDNIEKAENEAARILNTCFIKENYSHAVYVMLKHLLTSVIGLTYHLFINKKKKFEDYDGDVIICLLNELFENYTIKSNFYRNDLEYEFYLMGSDLFESFGEYKLPNHEYGYEAMGLWEKFCQVYNDSEFTSTGMEFKAALTELFRRFGY